MTGREWDADVVTYKAAVQDYRKRRFRSNVQTPLLEPVQQHVAATAPLAVLPPTPLLPRTIRQPLRPRIQRIRMRPTALPMKERCTETFRTAEDGAASTAESSDWPCCKPQLASQC